MDLSLALIFLIVIAGFIKGFTGFGLSLILISVLFEMGFTAAEFLPIIVPLFVILDAILYFENRKHINLDFKENFTIHPNTLMTLFIGVLLGTYLLTVMDGTYLKLGFAITILIMLFFLIEKVDVYQMKTPSERNNGYFGFGTGILTGLFTMNGIPPSLYLMYHQYPKEKYMANLVTFLIFSDIILVAVYMSKDLFTFSGFLISIKLFVMVLAINALKIIFDFFFK